MKVGDLCTRDLRTCHRDTSLAEAVLSLWKGDCGILPVVDSEGVLIGVLTDRDICLALTDHDSSPSGLTAGQIMMKDLYTCRPQDDLTVALEIMATYKVHRLPVTDGNGLLDGILSIDDLLFHSEDNERAGGPTQSEVVRTFKAIAGHYVERNTSMSTTGNIPA